MELQNVSAQQPTSTQFGSSFNSTVTVQQGEIEGIYDSGIYIFKGIPFAKPPVGDFRWREPQQADSWPGTKETKKFRDGCMQLPVFDDMIFRSDGFSEDCLYLNVWTPSKTGDEKMPVLVYFYGGGFMAGDGSEPRYDGASMARNHGIVTVTVNYRLGVFGFLAHPSLSDESANGSSGNYGLLDQAFALQWIRDNIEAFGGDPGHIVIGGESAGSISVSALMASPLSRGLIAGVIGESGSIMGFQPAITLPEAEANGGNFAETAGAGSLEDLRELPADRLMQLSSRPGMPRLAPAVDGYYFPKQPVEIYENGEQADVPLFAGWNSLEMNYRMILGGQDPTPENYAERIRNLYGEDAGRILNLYPGSTQQEVLQSATDLAGDRFISYSTWKWSHLHSQTSSSPVFRYYFTHPRPPMKSEQTRSVGNDGEQSDEDILSNEPKGAVHAAEIEYILGNLPTNPVFAWTEEDYKVSDIFQGYAANFVKTLDPNKIGLPLWKALNRGDSRQVLHIGVDTKLEEVLHEERYRALNHLHYPDQ